MAGTVVATPGSVSGRANRVYQYSLAWTSDAAGAVNGTNVTLIPGTIMAVTFVPGAGGVQPTDLYDVTLKCVSHGVADVLAGEGANLSNVNASHKLPFMPNSAGTAIARQWLHGGAYELVVANAGNAKQGLVDIFISPMPV